MAEQKGIGVGDIKQVQDYMRREFTTLMRTPEKTLYHYTDGTAAAAILDQSTLRATNILHLDDGREMQHALDCFQQALDRRQAQSTDRGVAELSALISQYLSEKGNYVPPDIWIATFTGERDSPELWHRFSGETHGVAFGFSPANIARAADTGGALLAPCCYDDETKVTVMTRGLELLQRLYDRHRGALDGYTLIGYIMRELALFSAIMKRSDLVHEDEWRLILCNPSQTVVGARRINALAKRAYTSLYIDLEIADGNGRLPLDEIIIGPSPYQQMTERAFRILLYKSGYEHANVTPSPAAMV
jgi:hypothetical protein